MGLEEKAAELLRALDEGEITQNEAITLAVEFKIPGFEVTETTRGALPGAELAEPKVPSGPRITPPLEPRRNRFLEFLSPLLEEEPVLKETEERLASRIPISPARKLPVPIPVAFPEPREIFKFLFPTTRAEIVGEAPTAAALAVKKAGPIARRLIAQAEIPEELATAVLPPAAPPGQIGRMEMERITGFMRSPEAQKGIVSAVRRRGFKEAELTEEASRRFETGEFLVGLQKKKARTYLGGREDLDDLLRTQSEIQSKSAPILQDTVGSVQGSRTWVRNFTQSVRTSLKKGGPESSKMADVLDEAVSWHDKKAGAAIADYVNATKDLTPEEKLSMTAVLDEQGVRPISSNTEKAVEKVRAILDRGYAESRAIAKGEGVVLKPRLKHYFPHEFDVDSSEAKKRAVEALVRKGKNRLKAEMLLENYIKQRRERIMPNIERSRSLDIPGYSLDPDQVIPNYLERVYKRSSELKFFGSKDRKIADLMQRAAGKENTDFMRLVFQRYTSTDPDEGLTHFFNSLKSYQVVTKLGLAQINNATQTLNTVARTNVRSLFNVLRNIALEGPEPAKDFALRTGATLNATRNEFLQSIGAPEKSWGNTFLKWTGFSWIEKWNRIFAANMGKDYAKQTFSAIKAGKKTLVPGENARRLSELGINVEEALKKGTLSDDDLIKAGQTVVNSSQFKGGALDLPLFWTSRAGKVVTQFKTFQFQQAKFVRDSILRETARGNFKPMSSFLAFGAALGYPVKELKDWLTQRKPAPQGASQLLDIYSSVGGFGIFADTLRASQKFGAGAKFLAGPTITTAGEAIEAIGQPKRRAAFVSRQVPVIGPALSKAVSP